MHTHDSPCQNHLSTKAATLLLHEAIHSNDMTLVRRALESGADVNTHDAQRAGWTPLHAAAYKGNCDMVKILLEHNAKLDALCIDAIASQIPKTWTPLFAAHAHPQVIAMLVEAGADIDYQEKSDRRRTVLHMVMDKDRPASVTMLLRLGARRDLLDKDGNTPLQRGIEYDAHDAVDAWNTYIAAEKAQAAVEGVSKEMSLRHL